MENPQPGLKLITLYPFCYLPHGTLIILSNSVKLKIFLRQPTYRRKPLQSLIPYNLSRMNTICYQLVRFFAPFCLCSKVFPFVFCRPLFRVFRGTTTPVIPYKCALSMWHNYDVQGAPKYNPCGSSERPATIDNSQQKQTIHECGIMKNTHNS